MKQISINDLEALALGAGVLGSGGGGDPIVEMLIAKYQIEKYGQVKLISFDELSPDDLIVPIGFMGAPLISTEKLPSLKEFTAIFESIEKYFGKKPKAIMPGEIGGANAFTPLIVSGMLNIPVLDADLLGRAFPELQMSCANLKNISSSPAFIADVLGNCNIIEVENSLELENKAREITVSMGSSAAIAIYIMKGKQIRNATINGSISKALQIGNLILDARKNKLNPVKTMVKQLNGIIIGSGIISDIEQSIKNGFLTGKVTISNDNTKIVLNYQNENLIVWLNDKIIATTPDIIIPLDEQNGTPITSESLAYGLRVSIIVLSSPEIWRTVEGLNLVGPRYFGYEIDYKSIIGNSNE